jgi:hypothetical protein
VKIRRMGKSDYIVTACNGAEAWIGKVDSHPVGTPWGVIISWEAPKWFKLRRQAIAYFRRSHQCR